MTGARPVSVALTPTPEVPEPASPVAVCVPYEVVLPNSKKYEVGWPCGLTVPVSCAPWAVTLLAFPVVAVGGPVGAATAGHAIAAAAIATVQNMRTRRFTRVSFRRAPKAPNPAGP